MHRTLRATDEGFDAGRRGDPLEANPYAGTDLAKYWLAGHEQGVKNRAANVIEWPRQRFAA
jgi:ribosome modulation factor